VTTKELKKYVEKSRRENGSTTIDTETGLSALEQVAVTADREKAKWALIGGIAMHIYGSDRMTSDVDVISEKALSLIATRPLGFGGERYLSKVGEKNVAVDWIVRKDEAKPFYVNALRDAVEIAGVPIITPEWLVILKYLAGRFKDQQDAVFLLKKKGLVNRRLIKKKVSETAGGPFWAIIANHLRRWYDLADGKITTEKEDYEADRL
jgi:hypothetical protein